MTGDLREKLYNHVAFIYGDKSAKQITSRIFNLLEQYKETHPELASSVMENRISERDSILITYGNMVQKKGQPSLQTLSTFLEKHLKQVISTIHVLPFFPYSSDDGFSVIDYHAVNPNFGNWEDISLLGKNFRLMFDAVVNHTSSKSVMFQGFIKGDKKFQDFFTIVDPGTDLTRVFRPRASPVLTPFKTAEGEKYVWTTFSADQIDLNYRNPDVLIEVINILLFYVAQGAEFIRLDAVTYLWKDLDTNCINLPETHRIIQLLRTALDFVAPNVALITETNVPHRDNIAYFGDGLNEAQMVYNFALPMLVLHAFHSESVIKLSSWANTLELPSDQATFLNFLAGHDGVGVTPVKNILSANDIEMIIERTRKLGGNIAYKSNGDGTQTPYELNINYLDALDNPEHPETSPNIIAKRFLAAQAIMLALRGVPGIYFHSMFGSHNWKEGVKKTGRYRTINREKLQLDELETELSNSDTLRCQVYQRFHHMLSARKANSAFNPFGGQEVLSIHPAIFTLFRISPDETERLLCLHNISDKNHAISIDLELLPFRHAESVIDILSQKQFPFSDNKLHLRLAPYEVLWLENN